MKVRCSCRFYNFREYDQCLTNKRLQLWERERLSVSTVWSTLWLQGSRQVRAGSIPWKSQAGNNCWIRGIRKLLEVLLTSGSTIVTKMIRDYEKEKYSRLTESISFSDDDWLWPGKVMVWLSFRNTSAFRDGISFEGIFCVYQSLGNWL